MIGQVIGLEDDAKDEKSSRDKMMNSKRRKIEGGSKSD